MEYTVSEHALFPYFQPIVETASGKIAGYEALARRLNEQGEVVSAGAVFNDPNLSWDERIQADRAVRYQALAALPSLPEDTFLSLNLSPAWLNYLADMPALPTVEMQETLGVDPSRVIIEITELGGDLALLRSAVDRYRDAGFRIAVDDFGADFSQLDRLSLLMPDIVKLDMKLLWDGLEDARNASMVQLLGEMASRMGAKVLCEGVETEAAFHLALSCNAYYTQGFLYSEACAEPTPVDCFRQQLVGLRECFRDMSLDSAVRNQWLAQKVTAALIGLREQIRSGNFQTELDLQHHHPASQIIRFYVCDRLGNQISPNYENASGQWVRDDSALGSNWSWRPYFVELLSSDIAEQRVLFSEPYHDIYAGELSQTAALPIDSTRILLVDLCCSRMEQAAHSINRGMRACSIPVS